MPTAAATKARRRSPSRSRSACSPRCPAAAPSTARNVVLMERRPIRGGRQVLRFVTDRRPTHAGVDPYNFYIDRNSDDNVAPVT